MASVTSHILETGNVPSVVLCPIYSGKVSSGQSRFPSPAQDYEQKSLDLNQRFVANPPATFFFEVAGDSMIGAKIRPWDNQSSLQES